MRGYLWKQMFTAVGVFGLLADGAVAAPQADIISKTIVRTNNSSPASTKVVIIAGGVQPGARKPPALPPEVSLSSAGLLPTPTRPGDNCIDDRGQREGQGVTHAVIELHRRMVAVHYHRKG
jgi:hypothetical protein